mmetsp:Transcript_29193/g.70068  ORF Transcript_29193/g.70068 Transcript_29193/m.70068 type:complete len:286 (-) Transcript_29193:186-1043(-)
MEITSLAQGVDHPLLPAHVGEDPELQLGVVRDQQRPPRGRGEAPPELRAPRHGLEVGVAAGEAPGGRGHSEAWVDPARLRSVLPQRPGVAPQALPLLAQLLDLGNCNARLLCGLFIHPFIQQLVVGQAPITHLRFPSQDRQHPLIGGRKSGYGDGVPDGGPGWLQPDPPDCLLGLGLRNRERGLWRQALRCALITPLFWHAKQQLPQLQRRGEQDPAALWIQWLAVRSWVSPDPIHNLVVGLTHLCLHRGLDFGQLGRVTRHPALLNLSQKPDEGHLILLDELPL